MDVSLPEGQIFQQVVGADNNVFIFVIEGELLVGDSMHKIGRRQMGVLHKGDQVIVTANEKTRFLLAAAHSLNEPVARDGPFVMNTQAEILQVFEDFQNNRFQTEG